MNKLKKISRVPSSPEKPLGQPSSSCLCISKSSLVRTSSSASGAPIQRNTVISTSSRPSTIASIRPQSAAEQYWATRALKAETLLSARTEHHRELKALVSSEAIKRAVCRRCRLRTNYVAKPEVTGRSFGSYLQTWSKIEKDGVGHGVLRFGVYNMIMRSRFFILLLHS